MQAKVTRLGDDLAILLTATEAERLGIREGAVVEVMPKPRPAYLTLEEMVAEMERLGPANRPDFIDWGPDVGAEIIRDDY